MRGRSTRKVIAEDGKPIAVIHWKPKKPSFPYPILLIHGFGQNWLTWDGVRGGMATKFAQRGFHTFAIDLRGSGFSRKSGEKGEGISKLRLDFNFDDFLKKDIPPTVSFILDVTHSDKIVLVGHSMGGSIAYSFCALNPHLVAGVVTLGSPYHYGVGVFPMRFGGHVVAILRAMKFDKVLELVVWRTYFLKILGVVGILGFLPMEVKPILKLTPLYPIYPRNFRNPLEFVEKLTAGFEVVSPKLFMHLLLWAHTTKITDFEGKIAYSDLFPNITCPVLVIAGKYDRLAPPESVKPIMDVIRSKYKLYLEFEAGHLDIVEGDLAREKVVPEVEKFIRRYIGR